MNAQASASTQVAASVRKTERLRQEAVEYRRIASAAVKGSQEQIAAANLAVRAESRLAASLGVTAAETNRMRGSSSGLEKDIGRASRGALAGSGVFRGLGRSIAFASGGFLAFASAGQFIRASIDAAKEAQVTQKQLGAQFRASGQDLNSYQGQIDKTANHLALLAGFENDQVKSAFITVFRATGDVNKSLRDTALAADIARAKHKDLAVAATLVAKVEAGNIGLLRRQGVQITKNATVEQALAQARSHFAGQAKAGTTEQERFGAVLHNTEEIIGTGVLPILNKYLASGAQWLTQMNDSGKLQAHVSHDMKLFGSIVNDTVAAIREITDAAGGFMNVLKGLLAFKVTSILAGWAASFVATGTAATAASTEMAAAKTQVASLRALSLAPIIFTVEVIGLEKVAAKVKSLQQDYLKPESMNATDAQEAALVPGLAAKYKKFLAQGMTPASARLALQNTSGLKGTPQEGEIIGAAINYAAGGPDKKRIDALRVAEGRGTNTKPPPAATPAELDRLSQIQNQVAAARLAVAQGQAGAKGQLVTALKAEIDFDKKYAAIQQRLYKQGGVNAKQHADAYQRLVADETSAFSEIDSLTKKDTSAAKKSWANRLKLLKANVVLASSTKGYEDDIKALKAEQAAIRQRIREHGKTGELEMQLAQVQKQLAQAVKKQAVVNFTEPFALLLAQAKAGATATTSDDVKVAREMKAFAEKMIKSGKLKGQALIDAWNEIAAANSVIAQDFAPGGSVAVSAESLVKGIVGLTLAQKKELEQRYAQAGAHGGHRPTGHGVLGQETTLVVNSYLTLDGRVIANSVNQHNGRAARHKAHQVRGPYAGRH